MDRHARASGAQQVALVAMRPDGAVVAMVGARNYEQSQFNRSVQAMRQPGSTFKLFVYFAALRNGYSINDTIEDAPLKIRSWKPKNFDERYHGTVSLGEAFARSLNVASVRLAQEVGIDQVVAAARLLGIDAPLAATPSLALGSSEVTLLDLTGAYASVLAGTAPIEPWGIATIESLGGSAPIAGGPAAKPRVSLKPYNEALIGLLKRAVEQGTGRTAQLDGFAAGKTGTTENHRDAWFVGFTKDLVAGVWVGNDNNEPMKEVTGGYLPAMIWKEFMAGAQQLPASEDSIAFASQHTAEVAQCDYAACSRSYRSFRASDCTYQPYRGPRRLCQHGSPHEAEIIGGFQLRELQVSERVASADALIAGAFGTQDHEQSLSVPGGTCNYDACAQAYRSFRASDCTYQPYRGPRRLCLRAEDDTASFDEPFDEAVSPQEYDEEDEDFETAACNYEACSQSYRSFRASDCSYQPYQGHRRQCRLGGGEDSWDAPAAAEEDFEYGDDYDDAYFE
jgi:hypothetical protein